MFNLPPLPDGSTIVSRAEPDRIELSWSVGSFPLFARLLIAGFLCLWLAGWAAGEWSAIAQLWRIGNKGGAGNLFAQGFLLFWLVGWTIGGLVAIVILFAILWPSRPERLILTPDALQYRPGWGATMSASTDDDDDIAPGTTRQELLRRKFRRRRAAAGNTADPAAALRGLRGRTVPKETLSPPRFERLDGGWRLSFDCGTDRVEIGAALTDLERLWLFDVLEFWRTGRLSPNRPDPADLLEVENAEDSAVPAPAAEPDPNAGR